MNLTIRALNRFGLGARSGEPRRIGDPRGWLRAQLKGGAPELKAPAEATPETITEALRAFRGVGQQDPQARMQLRRRLIAIAAAESRATLTERVTSDRPFVERLVAFWSNHLCISVGSKVLVAPLAGSYEREAIRPHVLGRFEDLVLASAKHPAMLVYLDNFQSIGPASPGARGGRGRGGAPPRAQARGLNENYARELLELHTLGVEGGYTQQDVLELAKILTGWTIAGFGGPGARQQMRPQGRGRRPDVQDEGTIGFAFRELLHEPGTKTVLGARYAEDGVEEGERAIRSFARHPSTARFVATKLVRHFVADDPPNAAVDRIASVFRETNGDLRAVANALVDLPDAWDARNLKFRTPQDWIVAMLRAFDATDANDGTTLLLRQLRHPLWSPQSPKGFGDTMPEWADPDSLLNRAELARTLTRRFRLQRVDPRSLLDVVDVPPGDPLRKFLDDNSIAIDERMALTLAGPVFQWR
jgi:uncharacterized protein (DUF1800 family)